MMKTSAATRCVFSSVFNVRSNFQAIGGGKKGCIFRLCQFL